MRCLDAILSMDGTLSRRERERRTQFFVVCAIGWCVDVLILVRWLPVMLIQPLLLVGTFFVAFGFGMPVVAVLCKRPLTTTLVVSSLYTVSLGMCLWDLNARAISQQPFWPLLVLMIDMLLVMQVPARYSVGLVCFIVLWLLLLGIEESFRFGLFDLPGLPAIEGEHGRLYYLRERFSCENLPCAVEFPPSEMTTAMSVFLLDFIATRGFARQVLKEQATMERTIDTVQEIATLLAGYDVEQVAALLEQHGADLPVGMTVALRRLEQNLRVYKAYLPQTCLLVDTSVLDNAVCEDSEEDSASVQIERVETGSTVATPVANVRHVPLFLSSTKATLLTVNIKDTLRFLEEDCASFSSFFTNLLLKTLKATDTHRGMVDVFIGDKVHCSFNTSKQCANHATSALRAASMLLQGSTSQVNIGVATGKVLRGDMGCEVLRRFSMVGALVRDVHGMERAGRILGCDVLCNRMCFSDAECEHMLRLIPCKVDMSAGCDAPEVVAELLPGDALLNSPAEEWMYQVGKNAAWETYNTSVRSYLKGDVSAAAVEAAAQDCPCERIPLNVQPSSVKGGILSVSLARPLQGETEVYKCIQNTHPQ